MDKQVDELTSLLDFKWGKPTIAEYDIDEFVY